MAKSVFVCRECGATSPKWLGRCPECSAWDTYVEQVSNENGRKLIKGKIVPTVELQTEHQELVRLVTGLGEVDLVFGGGIVDGSIVLLGGEPGIGKSTLTLQICAAYEKQNKKVLYLAGEESAGQIADRANRIGVPLNLAVVNEVLLEDVLATVRDLKPNLLVVDSIQVVYSEAVAGVPGSVTQVRFAAEKLMELAKSHGITVLLVGHVTKDGTLAGPRVLEHLVDVVLYLEGERFENLRLLKTFKNRFGATDEVGVFEMTEKGMQEKKNPTAVFMTAGENRIGSCLASIIEGTRPFFLEIQALVTYTKFGYPKRTVSGIDLNRLNIILAVLGKYTAVNLDNYDVYVSTVGGFITKDRGLDLAIALAIVSSKLQKEIPGRTLALGEIGLTGSVRSVSGIEKRVREAKKLGVERVLAPTKNSALITPVASVAEAVGKAFDSAERRVQSAE